MVHVGIGYDVHALVAGRKLVLGGVMPAKALIVNGADSGTFFDARLSDPAQFPVAAKSGSWNTHGTPDRLTAKLAATR